MLERPMLYISHQTTGAEPTYQSTVREVACLYWAINKLSLYLEGNTLTVYTDHECTKDVLQAAAEREDVRASGQISHAASTRPGRHGHCLLARETDEHGGSIVTSDVHDTVRRDRE
jgi:hypothetical protein